MLDSICWRDCGWIIAFTFISIGTGGTRFINTYQQGQDGNSLCEIIQAWYWTLALHWGEWWWKANWSCWESCLFVSSYAEHLDRSIRTSFVKNSTCIWSFGHSSTFTRHTKNNLGYVTRYLLIKELFFLAKEAGNYVMDCPWRRQRWRRHWFSQEQSAFIRLPRCSTYSPTRLSRNIISSFGMEQ